ncbi:bifunctional metallophosphatase/5'-nucleotidase [Ornithinibacillus californiensis]|uniref:bifunctional metallophosphatase/5'-nucleotidase n=1 Tax=Ornithinibacillus californiensis TaxID=161536 RepID=UPI00064D93EF|nr:bifunctional UDP-sugar hydrolase/5'-nucleotidase [Ornithinibacillus californiensis]
MSKKTTIKVLYTSDVHGNAMPILYGTNEPTNLGLAKYASIVKAVRNKNENVLVLDNGDLIQGTPLMTHYVKEHTDKENPMVGILNRIGVEAGVIGNHEFNFGKEVLHDAINSSSYPWLSANLVNEHGEPYFGKPYITKRFPNGPKVAIVGVTTHYIPNWESPSHIAGIKFKDALTTLKQWVEFIREEEQPDVLIAMYHGGIERDMETGEPTEVLTGENQGYAMCQEIEGIDILLTGHQHRILTGEINGVLVAQPGNNCIMYGDIDIELESSDGKWYVTHKNAEIIPVGDVQADQEILDYMTEIEESTQKWLDQPIGEIKGDMTINDPFEARVFKHAFVQFVQDVQLDASAAPISVTALLNNESKGFGSVVTMRDIVSNYMYPNTLVVLALTGKDIKLALEKNAEYFVLDEDGTITVNPTYIRPKPQHYNYDMWEGINYTINVSKPFGSRVEEISYQGKPLEESNTYHVVMNNYRATGGGNYDMFKNKPVIQEIQKDMVELISAYFEKHKIVTAQVNPNFIVKA